MADSEAEIGYGSVFEMADQDTPTVFIALGEVTNVDPGDDQQARVEVTHYQSPGRTREYIPGMIEPGSATVEMNYVPGSATDLAILAMVGKKNIGRITLPNGVRKTFPIIRDTYATAIPIDDRMTATLTLHRAGATTTDSAEAPVNGLIPSIAGIAQVDEVLTAVPGVWAPFATFTYQWKNEGVNIPGATGPTYTPVVGDVGDNLTVEVTATNGAGAASATSAETAPVLAA
ncbi:phage tail tube protein [Devosia sp.]|uniref:phage tail tube protein n=1 Tax=Devosia sp. TaxID=1871048 RepID=UPI001B0CE364|nr:phage tail tube protein [Devosia sp.]MBO9589066.1 histidine kinase [Devosia sp.]